MSLLLFKSPRRSQMLHTCVECGFVTPRRRAYEKHARACESARTASGRTLPDPPVCRNYRCHHCGSCTNKAKLFLFHLRDVHGENMSVFACDMCEYASRHKHKVFRHRKLVHKAAPPLTDLLPVDSEDSQEANVMAVDNDDVINDDNVDGAEDSADLYAVDDAAEDEEMIGGRAVANSDNLLVNEDGDVIDESTLGVYVVNPEPVDDDIDLTEASASEQLHGMTSTFSSRAPHHVASSSRHVATTFRGGRGEVGRGGQSSSSNNNRRSEVGEQQQHYHHQQQQQGQAVIFKCRLCPYSNPYKWKVAQHARTIHMRKTLYRCTQCDFTCERKIEWCVHKTRHSKKAVHSCDQCAYSTTMKRNFDRHMRRHSNGGPIKCGLCTYASTGEAAVQRHMAEFHPSAAAAAAGNNNGNVVLKPINGDGVSFVRDTKIKTERANTSAKQRQNQNQFRSNHSPQLLAHRVQSSFIDDDDDDDEVDSDQSMAIDIRSITDDIPAAHGGSGVADTAQYSCRFCQARFRDLSVLKSHVFVKHGEEAASALSDTVQWNTRSSQHQQQDQPLDLSNKDGEGLWLAGGALDDDQPLDLSAQGQGQSHSQGQGHGQGQGQVGLNQLIIGDMKYEAFDGPMKCPHCNYSASWPSDLQRHMMVHSLERRFRCYLCGRRYKHQFDLNAHLRRVHRVPAGRTAVPSAASPAATRHILGALLNDRSSLTTAHTRPASTAVVLSRASNVPIPAAVPAVEATAGEKLRCEFCNYVGKYRAEVERHMRLHTGDKPFACLFCSYRSFWKGDMKRHLVKHHPSEVDGCPDLKGMVNDTERLGLQLSKEDTQQAPPRVMMDLPSPAGSSQLSFDDGTLGEEVKDGSDDVSEEDMASSSNNIPLSFAEKQVFKCTQCPFQCDAPSKLKCHAEIHANLKRFKCPECGKRSNWTWDIKKHIRKDHVDQTLEVIELSEEEARTSLPSYVSTHRTCGRSGSESKESTPAREGIQRSLPDTEQVVATSVSKETGSAVTKGTVADDDSQAPLKPFKCSECPKRSNWKWDIQKHIRAAHAESGGKVIVFKGNKMPSSRPSASRSSLGKALSNRAKANQARHLHHQAIVSHSASSSRSLLKPLSMQPSDMVRTGTERYRPFKCSECGKRSNWKWDLNKHIASYHANEGHIVALTEDEARDTFDDYLRLQQKEKGFNSSTGDDDMMADFSEGNLEKHVANLNVAISLLSPQCDDTEVTVMPLTPVVKTHHSKDAKKQKKFKCSVCEYRSNYRSDIHRHLKRRHSDDLDASVIELSDREAAATLTEYRKVFGAKKFMSPEKRNGIHVTAPAAITDDTEAGADEASNNLSGNEENSISGDEHGNANGEVSAIDETPDTQGDCDKEMWVKVTAPESATIKGRGRHFCEWCPYVSINRNDYIYHRQFHRAKTSAPFKCGLCPYWVTQKRLLKQHEKVHQPNYKLRYYPTARLATDSQVSEPVNDSKTEDVNMDYEFDEAGKKTYKCKRCPYAGTSSERLVEHSARHRQQTQQPGDDENCKGVGSGDLLCCAYCDYQAASEEALSVHETVHADSYRPGVDVGSESEETTLIAADDDEWKCDLCSFHTMQYTRFEKHLLSHRTANNSLLSDDLTTVFSAVPADIAAAANLIGDDTLHPINVDNGGAAIFPGHSFDEQNAITAADVVTYDVNANVAEKTTGASSSTAIEITGQVA